MINEAMVYGKISPNWAEGLRDFDSIYKIWTYNNLNAELIQNEVDLVRLGGLVVPFYEEVTPRRMRVPVMSKSKIIDLAFSEPALGTSTSNILKGAIDAYGESDLFTLQLHQRTLLNRYHGGDETWFIPVQALEIAKQSLVV